MFGVILEAGPFEILDGIGLAVRRVLLLKFLAQRVAKSREPAIILPVGQEAVTEGVAGFCKKFRFVVGDSVFDSGKIALS